MKRLSIVLSFVVMLTGLAAVFGACQKTADAAQTYVALDINPSVEFVLDDKERVVAVKAANKDAEILLYGAEGIVGAKISDASKRVAELAIAYGFVTEENATINVTVSGKSADEEGKILAKIDASFSAAFDGTGLKIEIVTYGGVLLNARLENLKAQYPDNADIQALTAGKFRLIEAAMRVDGTLTVEAAAAMSAEDLSEILYKSEKYHLDVLSDKFEEAYEKLELAYEQNKDALLDGAYLTLLDNGADKALKATEYVALRNAYRAVEYIGEIEGEKEPVLTDEQLAAVAEAVGQNAEEFIAGVKAYGAATEDAVEYYLEKLYRNMSEAEREAMEDVYEAAEDLLEEIEDALEVVSGEILAEIKEKLAPVAEYLSIELDKIKEYDDIEDYVLDKMEERIEDIEDWFDDHLSKAEKKEVSDAKTALNDKAAALKEEFESSVAALKAQIEEELRKLQQERIEAAA